MSEFEKEVEKAKDELEKGLVHVGLDGTAAAGDDEFLGELKMQAQELGHNIQDAAARAKDFASEKFAYAGEKFKEIQNKDPRELVEDAKEFARQKPGQALLISAAVGLAIGYLLRRK